ncbi:MAG: carboxylating nicotinate-nucleotide diphosphorylase [Syntrophorhabdaceae bacterium]|nr:carboxylating nicotinate-nucleotide diphosphorylase [Syntrophorhabdaceae bacterium]
MPAGPQEFLNEDIGVEDVTTNAVVPDGHRSRAKIVAKAAGVLAGQAFAREVFVVLDKNIAYREHKKDGETLSTGDIIATIEGRTRAILTAERVALNILQRLSGIATLTRTFVDAASGTRARILDTRKTTPGIRTMEKYAVSMGGGVNHRRNLTEMALIKENHIAVAGSIGTAVGLVRKAADVPIEVEVRTMDELKEALEAKVERIMLDNWDTASMRDAVALVAGRVPIEASGNMTVERVREVAAAGVDLISVGALTHSAGALDISLLHEGVDR